MGTITAEQTNIYDFLGINEDPLYKKLEDLKEGEMLLLGETLVRKNSHGLYELETRTQHEQAKDVIEFYKKILNC
ncbi:hypothetical protein [Piscibacillus halophilus]|uniref:hypothetical protein n=1 Tax=Piscibacillus halophilus TaxID=571933 RepID=UPI00158D618C|nr:hypothetical protein [Piscibacillus halophilus]